jgi:hypothetical protein
MLAQFTPALDYPAYMPTELTTEFCVEDCIECMRACEWCAEACMEGLPYSIMMQYRQNSFECADLAMRTANALAHGDADALELCDLCAAVCDAWASECDAWETAVFQQCVDACRRCADSCRDVLGVA